MNLGRTVAWAVVGPMLLACSLFTNFDGIVPSSDAGGVDPGLNAACDLYYQDHISRCAGFSPSETARRERRWDAYCAALASVPGAAYTASVATACAQALATMSCNDLALPSACAAFFAGTLPGNVPCVGDQQCQSGVCGVAGDAGPGCSLCFPALANGQACPADPAKGICVPGSDCINPSQTCAPAIPGGDAGASCVSNACAAGLVCGAGGLCLQPTHVVPGQACDGDTTLCQVGYCPVTYTDAGVAPGTCPTIIPDGQVCDPASFATTCDAFAVCLGNTCTLAPSPSSCQ